MKKSVKFIAVVTMISMVISSTGVTTQAAGKPKLNKTSVTLKVGKSVKLKIKNKPKNIKVTWKSKNKKVANVSSLGKVTARKAGSTKIICVIKKGNKKVQLKCKVKVVAKNINQTAQPIQTLEATSYPGFTKAPTMTFLPNATATVKPTDSAKPSESSSPTDVPEQSQMPEESASPTNEPEQSQMPEESSEPTSAPTETPEATLEPTPTVAPVKIYTGSATIQLGMTTTELQETMGTAAYTLPAEYEGCEWYVYNADYTKFTMALVKDSEVVGVYADSSTFTFENITTASDVTSLTTEGYTQYSSKALYRKSTTDFVVWAYMDSLGDNTVEGIIITKQLSSTNSAESISSQEKISFEITNSFRAKNGLTALAWSDSAATVARKHSQDMCDNDYFSHTSLDGSSPWDRMAAAGLTYSAAAENIAWGYWDGIDATYGWINSDGHRRNMLSETVTNLGVGIDSTCTYYTQLFYKPW